MKVATFMSLFISILLLTAGCSGSTGSHAVDGKTQTDSADSSTKTRMEVDRDGRPKRIPDPRGKDFQAKMVYSSPAAKEAPRYDSATYVNPGPLSLLESTLHQVQPTDIDDNAPTPWFDGKINYIVSIKNVVDEWIGIDSIAFPDNRFETSLRSSWFPSEVFTFIDMVCDTPYVEDDYRIVVYFMDNKYPPQVLHINLHSDYAKLRAEKTRQYGHD